VIYHLATLEPPFTGDNLIALGSSIVNKAPKALPACYSQKLGNFVDWLLAKKPGDRPVPRDALKFIPTKYGKKIEDVT
jgi:NIMA (never in mitosis gene a)-related kinase